MYDIVTIGEALIDFASMETGVPLSEVQTFRRIAGGAPANVAIGAAKLDRKTGFITRVGNEAFGKHIIDTLEKYGVDSSGIQLDRKINTGLAFIGLPTPFSREFLFYRSPGADMMLNFNEIPEQLFDTRIFHFGSISLIHEPSATSTLSAVKKAKQKGAIISYDPNYRPSLWSSEDEARKIIHSAIEFADIIKINDDELNFLFNDNNMEKNIRKLLTLGPEIVLCTMGESGSIFATDRFIGKKDIIKLESVDSTGCGDSFLSGVLSVLADNDISEILAAGYVLNTAVDFGAAAAAITSTKRGVTEAMPDRKEIETLLKKVEDA